MCGLFLAVTVDGYATLHVRMAARTALQLESHRMYSNVFMED